MRTAAQIPDLIPFLSDISARGVPITHLLGFNEPEIDSQANLPVEQAVKLWRSDVLPAKQRFGVRLGSPGMSSDVGRSKVWLGAFFEQLGEEAGVDFLVLHWYGARFEDMKRFLVDMHDTFKLPVWVNEFACSKMGDGEIGEEEVERFLREAVKWLEQCEWVERYAYFGNGQGRTVGSWVGVKNDFCEEVEGCEGTDGRQLSRIGRLYATL